MKAQERTAPQILVCQDQRLLLNQPFPAAYSISCAAAESEFLISPPEREVGSNTIALCSIEILMDGH
jgi:hypothetical protein